MKVFFRKRKIIEEMQKKIKNLEQDIKWLKKDANKSLKSNKILNHLVNYMFANHGKSYAFNTYDGDLFEKMGESLTDEDRIKREGYVLSNSFSCKSFSGGSDDTCYIKIYIKE